MEYCKEFNYIKRSYNDVKDILDVNIGNDSYSKGAFSLNIDRAVGLNSSKSWFGISNSKGMYIADKNAGLGFFEWPWINKIMFKPKDEQIFIVFEDLDAILNNVILQPKFWIKMFYVTKKNGVRCFAWSLHDTENSALIHNIVQYIESNNLCPVERI